MVKKYTNPAQKLRFLCIKKAEPNLRTYSGGLNGPKSSGQSTTIGGGEPNLDPRRQVSMEESVKLERSLFELYKNYKG